MRTTASLFLALLIGCGAEDESDKSTSDVDSTDTKTDEGDVDDTGDADDTAEPFDAVGALKDLLVGHYDSADQAAEDRAYYDILLTMCPIDYPELGETVLYVEQTSADTPELLPPLEQPRFVHNKSGRFESRFSSVTILKSPAVLLQGMEGSSLAFVPK